VVAVRVIVVGAGEVGTSIADNLAESHDVVVVERDPSVVEDLTYAVDVLPIQGDGTDMAVLREAGIEDADMLIASTDNDEANIVACGTAKTVGDVFTVARVKRRNLLATWRGSEGAFGVDFMVSSDLLTAEAIFRISGVAGARDVDTFAGGLVRMAEFELREDCGMAGQTVQEADRWPALTFAAVFREEAVLVPTGDTRLAGGDRVVVIGSPDSVTEFAEAVAEGETNDARDVVIVGGSEVGFQTARTFEDHGYAPRLVERDPDRARELAEDLPRTTVLQNDATDVDFLEAERVDDADVIVAALSSDERNLLVSMLAERIGVERSVSVVQDPEYVDLFETVGVDVAVNPREETAEEIIRFTRDGATEKVAMLEHDRAEVLEVELDEESALVGRPLSEAVPDLPESIVVGAASRSGTLVTPRGDTVLQAGDHAVLFAETDDVEAIVAVI
jgi:trk system potassium uptake protein TrkA